jgi:hypothetical protein
VLTAVGLTTCWWFLTARHLSLFRQAKRGDRIDELLEIMASVDMHSFGGPPERTVPAANPLEAQAIHRLFEHLSTHGWPGVSLIFMKYLGLDWSAVSPPHRHSKRGFRHLDRVSRELPASADLDNVVQQWNTEIYSAAVYFVEVSHSERL